MILEHLLNASEVVTPKAAAAAAAVITTSEMLLLPTYSARPLHQAGLKP